MRQHAANERLQQFASAPSPALAEAARTALKDALAVGPRDGWTLWSLIWLDMQTDIIGEAGELATVLVSVEPGNKDAHYTLAVVRWMAAYRAAMQARRKAGMKAGDPPPIGDPAVRDALRKQISEALAEGHRALGQALALAPEFREALLYDNMLFRLEAEIAASPDESQSLLVRARERVKAALAIKPAPPSAAPALAAPGAPPPRIARVPAPPPPPN